MLIYAELTLHRTVSVPARREHHSSAVLSSEDAAALCVVRIRGVRGYFGKPFRGIRISFHPLVRVLSRTGRSV